MSNNRLMLITAITAGLLVVFSLSDPAHARRDTTVDVCPPGIACGYLSPGHGRDSSGGPRGGGDDSSGDDSSGDDTSGDDTSQDDTDSDNTIGDTFE